MRKQVRAESPEEFRVNSDKWNDQWQRLRSSNPSATFSWYRHGNQSARDYALPVLRSMNQGHCSFCDTFPIADRSKEPIEHFRPKSTFPEAAYEWTNLYYCCDACQSNKGEKWENKLLRPDDPTYQFARYFEFDFETGEIRPNSVAIEDDRHCATITIEVFALDDPHRRRYRKLELRRWIQARDANDRSIDEYAYRDFLDPPTSPMV